MIFRIREMELDVRIRERTSFWYGLVNGLEIQLVHFTSIKKMHMKATLKKKILFE